jgi:hypothetical protein
MRGRAAKRQTARGIFPGTGNKTRASGVFYTTEHERSLPVNLFQPCAVLLNETAVNQVTWPPPGRTSVGKNTMLSRRWSTNDQRRCTGQFAYEPANTVPVRTLRL